MSLPFLSLADHYVSVSEFSQGGSSRIFTDVSENNQSYVVVKNNRPAAVILPVGEYREVQDSLGRLQAYTAALTKLFRQQLEEDAAAFHSPEAAAILEQADLDAGRVLELEKMLRRRKAQNACDTLMKFCRKGTSVRDEREDLAEALDERYENIG